MVPAPAPKVVTPAVIEAAVTPALKTVLAAVEVSIEKAPPAIAPEKVTVPTPKVRLEPKVTAPMLALPPAVIVIVAPLVVSVPTEFATARVPAPMSSVVPALSVTLPLLLNEIPPPPVVMLTVPVKEVSTTLAPTTKFPRLVVNALVPRKDTLPPPAASEFALRVTLRAPAPVAVIPEPVLKMMSL